MILDSLDHAREYTAIGPGIARALQLLCEGEVIKRPVGRYEFDGDRLFMMMQEYHTRLRADGFWEAHRRYIDLQFVVSGMELMGRADIASLVTSKPYDSSKDVEIFDGAGDFVHVPASSFIIFYPHDAHMPCIAEHETSAVRKLVFKIAVD